MAQPVKSQQGMPSLARPPLGIMYGALGDPADQSLPNYPRGLSPSMRSKGRPLGAARGAHLGGSIVPSGRSCRQDGCESQSHLPAVFLAKVDMDGVLYD